MKAIKNKIGKYILHLPENYESSKSKWPLLLFLHGAGECGNNLDMVLRNGPPMLADKGKEFPFIVLSPQCPIMHYWENEILDKLLLSIVGQYRVNTYRVYLTGLSMGGFGTWSLAKKHPRRFAAIAPVCGGANPHIAEYIKHIPCWIFHGAKDQIIPLERSQEMADALKKRGANVKFTVYPFAEHDSWTETYNNDELYEWFMEQKLG